MSKVVVANYWASDFPKVIAVLDDSTDEVEWVNKWLEDRTPISIPVCIDVTEIDEEQRVSVCGSMRYLVCKGLQAGNPPYIKK